MVRQNSSDQEQRKLWMGDDQSVWSMALNQVAKISVRLCVADKRKAYV
jgi:hypothetical protein